jgi:hypothetical protein
MAEILGAVAGLAGAAAQSQSAGEAAIINLMNLRFQERNAAQQYDLQTATRTDAYGNKQRYNRATNSWETVLSPLQAEIISAGQNEQLKSLTVDARRNRQILEDAAARGEAAKPDYNIALAGFRYDQPPSRAALEDTLASKMQLANQMASGRQAQDVGRTLIRQGRGADLPAILKAADDAQGRNVAANQLEAYKESIPLEASLQQQHQSKYLPVLQQLQQTMMQGGGAPIRMSDTPQALSTLQQQQSQGILQALQNSAGNIGNAYNAYAKGIADTAPDLKGLASLIGAFKGSGGGGGGGSSGQQPQYGLVPTSGGADSGNVSGDTGFGLSDQQASDTFSNFFSGGDSSF